MTLFDYCKVRKQIYVSEIKHCLKQVEHLFVASVMFLGTALPALFFGLLLSFGVIFDNESSLLQILMLVWSLIATQTMILMLCRGAILGSRYAYYLQSIERSSLMPKLVNLLFTILSNPILLLCIFVILSIAPSHYPQVVHGFILLFMLMLGSYYAVFASSTMQVSLLLCLLSIPLLNLFFDDLGKQATSLSLLTMFGLMLSTYLIKYISFRSLTPLSLKLPINIDIWWTFFVGRDLFGADYKGSKVNTLLLSVMACMLITVLSVYSTINLPLYKNEVIIVATQLLVFQTSAMQLGITKLIDEHSLFFSQYQTNVRLVQYQVIVPLLIFLFYMCLIGSLTANAWVLLGLISFYFCFICAQKRQKLFVLVWLLTSLANASIYRLLM